MREYYIHIRWFDNYYALVTHEVVAYLAKYRGNYMNFTVLYPVVTME